METSIFDTLDAQTPATPSAMVRYLQTITEVEVGEQEVYLTSTVGGVSRKTHINWSDGLVIKRQTKKGVYRTLKPRYSGKYRNVLSVNVLNGTCQVAALIIAALTGAWGGNAPVGMEYNHHLPSGLHLPEVFGQGTGSFCPADQNRIHWLTVNRIYKDTGLKVSLSSYSKAYALLCEEKINKEDVLQYKHIVHEQYIEIIE